MLRTVTAARRPSFLNQVTPSKRRHGAALPASLLQCPACDMHARLLTDSLSMCSRPRLRPRRRRRPWRPPIAAKARRRCVCGMHAPDVATGCPITAAPPVAELCHPCMPQKWSKGKMKEKVNNQVLFDAVSLPPPLPNPNCAGGVCSERGAQPRAVHRASTSAAVKCVVCTMPPVRRPPCVAMPTQASLCSPSSCACCNCNSSRGRCGANSRGLGAHSIKMT